MKMLNKLLIIYEILYLIVLQGDQSSAFWLTDGISLTTTPQEPAQSGTNQLASVTVRPELSKQVNDNGILSSGQAPAAIGLIEPWVWILGNAGQSQKQYHQQQQEQHQQQQQLANQSLNAKPGDSLPATPTFGSPIQPNGFRQQQEKQPNCQCNSDWLANETNSLLNKWLASTNFANQVRAAGASLQLAISSTNEANSNNDHQINRQAAAIASNSDVKHLQLAPGNGQSNTHISVWTKPAKSGNGGSINNNNSNNNNNNGGSGKVKGSKWHPNHIHRQQQATPVIKLVPGERGPKGDQGERGEQGERGPSCLITVKDRDELFDLGNNQNDAAISTTTTTTPSTTGTNNNGQGQGEKRLKPNQRKLAFIESEQLLVVDTSSGWRPIQLMAPIRDFRKIIDKFSLINTEDRSRLMASVDDSRKVAYRSIKGDGRSKITQSMLITNNLLDGDDYDDEDDDDDDDYGRVNESDDINNEIDDDDDDEDEADDDDDADDDDFEDAASDGDNNTANVVAAEDNSDELINNLIHSSKQLQHPQRMSSKHPKSNDRTNALTTMKSNDVRTTNQGAHKRGQVSGRSAIAPSLSKSATNSDSIRSNDESSRINKPPDVQSEGEMKLRLIALNEPFSGNVHGLRGANFECKRNAAKANVKGAFRAFLATNYQNLNEVVRQQQQASSGHQKYPIVNLRGETLAASWQDMFKQPARVSNPLSRIYSFDGRHVATDSNWPNKLVWHGSGNKFGQRNSISMHNCDGWHSDSLNKFGFASPLRSPKSSSAHLTPRRMSRHQRSQKGRRFLDDLSGSNSSNATATANDNHDQRSAIFDPIDKYPCRMPLIVLCIETVAQANEIN